MENKTKLQEMLKKRNFYTIKDSGKIFLYALLLPLVVGLIFCYVSMSIAMNSGIKFEKGVNVIEFLFNNYYWFSIPYMLLTQLVFVLIYFVYQKANRISFSASKIYIKNTKPLTALFSSLAGIVCVLGFVLLIEVCFGKMFTAMGLEQTSLGLPINNVGWYFLNLLVLGVVPAICEELLFRGIIFQGLKENFSKPISIVLSALIFALVHQSIQQFIYPFLLGLLLAFVFDKTNNLIYSILIHMFNNFTTLTLRFLAELNIISFDFAVTWWVVLLALLAAAATVAILWLVYRFYLKKHDKIEVEKEGELVQTAPLSIGKFPMTMIIGFLAAVVMIVINTIG